MAKAAIRIWSWSLLRLQRFERSLPAMDPIEIRRPLVTNIHIPAEGISGLILAEVVWLASDSLRVHVTFRSDQPDVPDVPWVLTVPFLQDALRNGQAGHPNVSPCLAEVSGEDFILTLRGFRDDGQVRVSHTTWDLEQVQLFVQQIEHIAGELNYAPDVEAFLNRALSEDVP